MNKKILKQIEKQKKAYPIQLKQMNELREAFNETYKQWIKKKRKS